MLCCTRCFKLLIFSVYPFNFDTTLFYASTFAGILRSDYMLHHVENDARDILQVEINTIASSFGSLSTKISEMHRFFYEKEDSTISVGTFNISLWVLIVGL